MKDVQCYELFGGIALRNHAFSFSLGVRRRQVLILPNEIVCALCIKKV